MNPKDWKTVVELVSIAISIATVLIKAFYLSTVVLNSGLLT
jgi:hypothetical protein